MPIFQLACECGESLEKICSYKDAQETECPSCKSLMKIQPVKAGFKINGYSESNGYHRETIDYAKGVVG